MILTRQPQTAARVNRGSALARGLVGVFNPAQRRMQINQAAPTAAQVWAAEPSGIISTSTSTAFSGTWHQVLPATLLVFGRNLGGNNVTWASNVAASGGGYAIGASITPRWRFQTDAGSGIVTDTSTVALDTSPHVLIGTFDNGAQSLYVDGVSVLTATRSVIAPTTANMTIGSGALLRFYLFAMWNRALSAAEASAIGVNPWLLFEPTPTTVYSFPTQSTVPRLYRHYQNQRAA